MNYQELEKLFLDLHGCWNVATAYKGSFDPHRPESGQCAVTSIIVQDKFGGMIVRGDINDGQSHYWNVMDDETIVDLTRGQFPLWVQDNYPELATKEDLLEDDDTKKRYELLKIRLENKNV